MKKMRHSAVRNLSLRLPSTLTIANKLNKTEKRRSDTTSKTNPNPKMV